MDDPNRLDFFSSHAGGGAATTGFIFMHLKDPKERPKIPSQTMVELRT